MKNNKNKNVIIFDFNDPYSIQKAERKKFWFESNGFKESFTQNIGFDKWKIVFEKIV
jgi:hypothetical protein